MPPLPDRPGADGWRFRVLAVTLLLALVVPRMIQRGMFLDGVTYAVLARNMAIGVGTLWAPSFSTTVYRTFHEQLPLGLGVESLAFRLLGDSLAVERIFSVAVLLATGVLMMALWRAFLPRRLDSTPLFFWVLPSVVTWAAINNMLENVQGLFTIAAVYALVRADQGATAGTTAGWSAAGGVATLGGFLAKGPVGLFPLAVPPLLLLARRTARPGRVVVTWAVLLASASLAMLALFAYDPSRAAMAAFVESHLVPALQGRRGLPRTSVDIARHLTLGIWARMAALLVVVGVVRWRQATRWRLERSVVFFFAVGLVASLPVLVSPVLAGHYFVPAVPFFALAAGALAVPFLEVTSPARAGWRTSWPVAVAGGLAFAVAGVIMVHGTLEPRDREMVRSLDALAGVMPASTTIGTCAAAAEDWGLHGYVQRFFRSSLDPRDRAVDGWFLVANEACLAPAGCAPTAAGSRVALYRCEARGSATRSRQSSRDAVIRRASRVSPDA
jgi:4-amino-4-deoxy-L-arabinose transferase-like glycosyltransferase